MHPVFLIIIVIIFAVSGQMCFKAGMKNLGVKGVNFFYIARNFLRILIKPLIFSGFVLFGLSFLMWLVVLSRVDLSYAVPLLSLSYIAILILSFAVFKEKIGLLRLIGVIIVCIGAWLITLS